LREPGRPLLRIAHRAVHPVIKAIAGRSQGMLLVRDAGTIDTPAKK